MNDFLNENIFDVDCDLLIIPISTAGTISNSFRSGLEKLDIATDLWENKDYELGDVKILPQKSKKKFIAFVCTVDGYGSAYYAIRLIGKRLAEKVAELKNIREIACPILGTGAGKLQPHLSLNIMRSAFYENKNVESILLTFCTPDPYIHSSIGNYILDIDTPSGQLVIEAEVPNIRINELVEKIQYDKEFHFQLAIDKFNEYIDLELSNENFYKNLHEKFKASKLNFKEFINSDISNKEHLFTSLCGELIAYIDSNAYHKNIWNKYSDKRTLAKAGVRQNNWFENLIKYKRTKDLNAVSSSIRNALKYLTAPERNFTMLSESHRKQAFENIFPDRSYNKEFEDVVLAFFRKLGIKPQNHKNFGALCSRILYLPFIKPIWNTAVTKDIEAEEKINLTDLSRVSLLIEACLKNKSKKLDIGNCGLRDLTIIPELFECTHLEELILSNEWAVYEGGTWRQEVSNNKGTPNNISIIPESISQLTELKTLICGGDWDVFVNKKWNRWGISTLAPITKLRKLEHLNISNNRLTGLTGLNKLTSLQFAHLNNNEILRVEPLAGLIHLKELNLSNNKIEKTEFLSAIHNIQTLDLHHNFIRDLRPLRNIIERIGISNDKWGVNTLNIAKNPLEHPPMEIVNLGKEAVIRILQDIEKSGSYINKDVKIILVGNSEVGKSTLVKYLDEEKGLEDEHEPTLWMAEKEIKSKYSIKAIGEECLLHIFDFGGHDYYHDTHHLFYGTNTIYLLLWDDKTNNLELRKTSQKSKDGENVETQDYPLKYWLDSVKFHTRDIEADNFEFEIEREVTYNSSLLVIQNKVSDASKIIYLDNKQLKTDYSFIYDIINISIKRPKRNLTHFDNLFNEMLNNMKIIGAILPKFYEQIKNSIPSYDPLHAPILTFIEFLDYCNNILKNSIDEDQCRTLVRYLDQVGMLLYSDKTSEGKVYINKRWLIDTMHKILEKLTERKGKFDKSYAMSILGTKEEIVNDVLAMMQEFRMIFKHPYSDTFIAPLYLPLIPDGKVNLFLNKRRIPFRRFEYNGFIHKSVILSIFQKFGTQYPLDKNNDLYYYWKNGLIIKNPTTEEIIMIKFHLGNADGNACIDIYDLTNHQKSGFRDEVINYIREVNQDYELEEMVTLDGEEYVSKELLEENAKIGKHIFSEKKLSEPLKSEQHQKLFKLKDYMEFIDNPVKKKKVVISYSKKDVAQIHTLKRYLRPLVDAELIEEPWYCTLLNPGDDWDAKIKHKFLEADIVFFMVSEYFYSTKYIVDKEIKVAIDRYNEGESIKIIPIILEFYDWGRKEPYNLQLFSALPYQAKPISDFNNPKIAWNTITASVKMMIEKDLDPGKIELIGRDLEEIYERQVKGKLDSNSL